MLNTLSVMRFLISLSIIFSSFNLSAQFDDHPVIKYVGKVMGEAEADELRARGYKEGFAIHWHTSEHVVESVTLVVIPGKPNYSKRFKAYKGDIPYCPTIERNRAGDPFAILLTCPPADAKINDRKSRSDEQFRVGDYIFSSKRDGYFGVYITLPKWVIAAKRSEGRGFRTKELFDSPDFDPANSLTTSYEELLSLNPPTGQDVWRVAGSDDWILSTFYSNIDRNSNQLSINQYSQRHWAEWDILETNDPEGLRAENQTRKSSITSNCDVFLTKENGIILSYGSFPDGFPIALPANHKLSSTMDVLHKDPRVKSIQYFNHPKRNIRITVEVETEYGLRYLDFYQENQKQDYYKRCIVHRLQPPLYGDIEFWRPLIPGETPWNEPFQAYSGWANKNKTEKAEELCSTFADAYEIQLKKDSLNKIRRIATGLIKASQGWEDVTGKNISDKLDNNALDFGQFNKEFNCPEGVFVILHITDSPGGSKIHIPGTDQSMFIKLQEERYGTLTLTPYTIRCSEEEIVRIWAVTNKNSENNYLRILKVRDLDDK